MSEVLAVLRKPGHHHQKPLLIARCANCGREYQVAASKIQILRETRCAGCKHDPPIWVTRGAGILFFSCEIE